MGYVEQVKGSLLRARAKLEDPNSKAEDGGVCECFRYFFFLIVFTTMCTSGRTLNAHNYWISHQFRYSLEESTYGDIMDQSKLFSELNEAQDILLYLEQIVMPLLYVNMSHTGESLTLAEKNFVLAHNKLLGGVRITVIRVNEVSCQFKGLPDDFSPCYTRYTSDATNKSTYWVGGKEMPYLTANEANSETFHGRFMSYGGDGNIYDLSAYPDTANTELKELFENGLIGRDARVLFVDFVTLNANLNLHTVGRLCFELPADGGVVTYSEIKTWRFWRYLTSRGKRLFAMEIIVTIMVVFYTWEELSEIYKDGFFQYRRDFWNWVDWVNLLFFYTTIFWRIRVELSSHPSMTNVYTYESYRTYVWIFSMEATFNMVNAFLLYFKLFKYLNISRNVRVLFMMFEKTASDMLVFVIILVVFFLAFGIGGFSVFSSNVSDYRTFSFSIINLFRYTVTEMDYEALIQANVTAGTIYYMIWTLLMFLILVNVFIAILSDGFAEAQEEKTQSKEESVLPLLFISSIPNKLRKILFDMIDANKDGLLDKSEIAKHEGITEDEAAIQIKRFDKNNDGKLDEAEFNLYGRGDAKI